MNYQCTKTTQLISKLFIWCFFWRKIILSILNLYYLDDCPSITAFHQSVSQNLPLLFREFLDSRSSDVNVYNELGECGLSKACATGHNDMVLTLLQNGADVNLPNMFTRRTPLMTAAYHGHCDVIRILAHNDADATLKDMFVQNIYNKKLILTIPLCNCSTLNFSKKKQNILDYLTTFKYF